MIKRLRAVVAMSLSLALVLLSPGGSAYQAAAQTMSATTGASATGVTGAVGSNLGASGVSAVPTFTGATLGLNPTLSAPSLNAPALQTLGAAPVKAAAGVAAIGVPAGMTGLVAPSALVPVKAAAVAPAKVSAVVAAAKTPASVAANVSALNATLPAASASEVSAEKQALDAAKTFDGAALKTASALTPNGEVLAAASKGDARTTLKKGEMPEANLDENGQAKPADRVENLDGIGNPQRSVDEHGPDSNHGGALFGLFGVGLLGGGAAAVAGMALGSLAMFPMIILSLVLHEIGHARMADKLGDPTARLQNRASFNPKHWMTHIDPIWTLLIPAVTFLTMGMIFGGARPVPVEPRYFKNPTKGMAIVALAGPAVNLGLAVAGALAFAGAAAAGLGAGLLAMLGSFIFLNVLLAVFNLIPIPPLDGSHVLRSFLSYDARAKMDAFVAKMGPMGLFLPLMLVFMLAGNYISMTAMFVTKLLIGAVTSVLGVHLSGMIMPVAASLGLAVGQLGAQPLQPGEKPAAEAAATPGPSNPNGGGAASSAGNGPVDLIVMFGDKKATLHDAHISQVDVNMPNGVEQYTRLQQAMLVQLESAGLDAATLEPYQGTPQATYKRINAATIRVEGSKAAEFSKLMQDKGFTVYPNSRREIIRPITVKPEDMDPSARNAVTMDENLKIVKADYVHAIAEKRWGKPELGVIGKLWAKVFKSEAPQPKFGVIDSGADLTHPLLKRVKEVKNMTSGENVDDIGHGSWVTSTVLHLAPWSKNVTHYKTFLNGGATLDDILKSLTQAGNDGNLVISNSWGDDEGDPQGPDAQLVRKLAEEGHIMVFAAGNAGSGKNTIGAPAIVTYKDQATGAIRVVSVAAAGRDKKVAYFSSRGPGSPKTSKDPNYKDHRPDLTAVGYNIEGAWPKNLGDADREDGDKGTVKAISGTSMSTPGVAGAISLLAMMFGVTEVGPALDAIVNAVMSTLEKTGKNTRDEEGEGFLNLQAAYEKLDPSAERARLTKRLDSLRLQRVEMLRAGAFSRGRIGDVGDEMLAHVENVLEPEMRAVEKRLAELDAAGGLSLASYRALNTQLNTLHLYRSTIYTTRHGAQLWPEGMEIVSRQIEILTKQIAAMEAGDKTLRYRAAGPVKQYFMRLFGRAP